MPEINVVKINESKKNTIINPLYEDMNISIAESDCSITKIGEALWEFHEKINFYAKKLSMQLNKAVSLNEKTNMEDDRILLADLGYPTFPVPETYKKGIIEYFDELELNNDRILQPSGTHNGIRGESYGVPSGFEPSKKLLSLSFSRQYGYSVGAQEIFIT